MTRSLFVVTLSLLAAGQVGPCQQAGADELFSRVPIDSVFVPGDPAPASRDSGALPRPVDRGQKVLSVDQLADLLRDAGLDPQMEAEKVVGVQLQQPRGTFSLALALTEDRDQIEMVLKLSDATDQLSTAQLLALLAANREHQPAVFVFSQERKRLELWLRVANFDVTPRTLREEMRRLTTIAESTANLWESGSASSSTPVSPSAAPPTQVAVTPKAPAPSANPPAAQQPAPNAASPLTGKWSAARSAKEAFAMLLKDDGSFVLVYVKDGKQSRSTGTFTMSGTQLTLTGSDGSKLVGTVGNLSTSGFEFTPQNAATGKLTFRKAS